MARIGPRWSFSMVLLLALFSTGAHVQAQVPISLDELLARGGEVVVGEQLRRMMEGHAVLIEELATQKRFEAIFFASGVRILRPIERVGSSRALMDRGLSNVARYTIADDRLSFSAGEQRYDFQVYRLGDTTYGYRLQDGEAEAGWRFTPRDMGPREYATTGDMARRGIAPLDGARLRQLIAGRTLTMLKRSTGELYEIEFGADGQSRLRDSEGRDLGERRYSVFQDQLVMEIEGRASYVSVYPTPLGFLAARSIDDGAVDWELLKRE